MMSVSPEAAIRVAGPHDAAAVGAVLAAAVMDTVISRSLPGDHTAGKRLLRRVCTALAAAATVHGVVHLHDGAGAAIWLPITAASGHHDGGPAATPGSSQPGDRPGTDAAAVDDVLDTALLELDTALTALDPAGHGGEATPTLLHALGRLLRPNLRSGTGTPRRAAPPGVVPVRPGAVFLLAVAVAPHARRAGVARQLLNHQHAILDQQHTPLIAVAVDRAGAHLLSNAGYAPHHVDQLPGGVSVQWVMRTTRGAVDLVTPRIDWEQP